MCRGFSGQRLFSEMEWFFHSLGEAVSRFQDEVVCGGQGCWDKVETLGKYLSLNGGQLIGTEISHGFISEVCFGVLGGPTLGVSEVSHFACLREEFLE